MEEDSAAFGAQQTSEAVRGCGVGRAGEGMGAVVVSICVYGGGHWAAVCGLSNGRYAERYVQVTAVEGLSVGVTEAKPV